MKDSNSLIIKNISHFYKENKSINNFSLTVNTGEVVSIIGPSGCGKTTLLRIISGFENPISGQIKIGDYLVAEENKVAKDYDEKNIKEYMKWDSIKIDVNLNLGNASYTVYTCDLTHDYIDINADYRN